MSERYYVYAITDAEFQVPHGLSGFGAGALFVLSYADLGAVVSRIPATSGGEGETLAPTPENLMLHETLVEAIHATGSALPVRFGTALPDTTAIRSALSKRYASLRADVERLGGKVEVGVSVLWQPLHEDTGSPVDGQDADDRRGPDAKRAERRPGLAYLRARQQEYQQAEAVRARAQALAHELDTELGSQVIQRMRTLCPSTRLALRERYLLERDRVSAFKAAFDAAQQRHQEMRFLLTGPWPPYSFVTPPAPDAESEGIQRTRPDRIEAGIE